MSRLRSILEAHAPSAPAGRAAPAGPTLRVRPDALLVDPDRGRLALGRFRSAAAGPAWVEVLAASDRSEAPAWGGGDPEWAGYADLARACGARLVPPRGGDRASIALDALGAPGRLLASVGDLSVVGALGALAWQIGELEAAALMAGVPLEIETRPPLRVQIDGVLPPRVEGHDVACTLLSRWPGIWRDAWVEFQGDGLAALEVSDRARVARALAMAGARAVVFPSDEATREFLRARGREADWRRTEPTPGEEAPLGLDLGWVVPQAIGGAEPQGPASLSWWSGAAVGEVVVGREATYEELARLASLLAGRHVADGVWMSVGPTGDGLARAADATGLRGALSAAGVRWRRDDDPGRPCRRPDVLRLHYPGLPQDAGASDWAASLQACAAAASAGLLEDPHRWPDARTAPLSAGVIAAPPIPGSLPIATPSLWVAPNGARSAPRASAPLCGPVFARWTDDLDPAGLLPWGPRVRSRLDSLELGADLLPGAARLAGGPGSAPRWLVVQGAIRGLETCEAGLLALREAGVRAVLAAAIDPRTRRRCAEAGLLAIRAARAGDLAEIGPGDELELVGGVDLVTIERSRVVRDLTRARALVVVPELTEREWEWARAGGRLGWGRSA